MVEHRFHEYERHDNPYERRSRFFKKGDLK
jgi:hypothetical protein